MSAGGDGRLPRALLGVLAAHLVLNLATALALQPPWNETVFTHFRHFLEAETGSDSWGPMEAGLSHIEAGGARPVYQETLFSRGIKFQYPPTSLLALEALRALAASPSLPLRLALNVVTWLAVAVTALAAAVLLRGNAHGRRGAALSGLALAGTLLFYPVLKAYTLGQIQAWITTLLALLLVAWVEGRRATAGVLLGLVCLAKPHFAVVGVWALLRRQRRFLAAAAATGAVGLLVSLSRYGLAHHLDYLRALSFLARHGESFYPNQSMNGLLHRLLFNGNNLEWLSDRFPPFHPVVFAGTLLSSLVLLALALWPTRGRSGGGALDLAAVLVACTLASPIAWEHHYAVLAPVFALVARAGTERLGRGGWTLLAVSYLLSASFLAGAQRLADTWLNPLQSYLYFGGLAALALLLRLRQREDQPDAQPAWVRRPASANSERSAPEAPDVTS